MIFTEIYSFYYDIFTSKFESKNSKRQPTKSDPFLFDPSINSGSILPKQRALLTFS